MGSALLVVGWLLVGVGPHLVVGCHVVGWGRATLGCWLPRCWLGSGHTWLLVATLLVGVLVGVGPHQYTDFITIRLKISPKSTFKPTFLTPKIAV